MLRKKQTHLLWISSSALAILSVHSTTSAQTDYEYDALGRLKAVTYDDGSEILYSYDALGNRTSVIASGPAPSFSVDDVTVTEGSPAVFTITKTGTTSQSYSVSYGTADQTATAGSDYTAQSNTITFAPNEITRTVTVPTADDSSQENTETFALNLNNPSGGASITDSQGVGTIEDNDTSTAVSFSVNDVSADEGDALVFTISKSGNDGQSHSVEYSTDGGTAGLFDFTDIWWTTISFSASETTKTVSVQTTDDSDEESDETVFLELQDPSSGATISDDQGIGTILDNDGANAPVQFSVNDVSITEGGNLVFTVTKTGDDGQTHTVDYDSEKGTAGIFDFTDVSGTLTFTSTQFSKTVSVPTDQDTKTESDETVILKLENPSQGSGISDDEGVGTIIDDD